MKQSIRAALVLAAALCAGPVLAEDAAAPAESPKPHHHHHMAGHGGKHDYGNCVKEKSAVAEYFCSAHGDTCQAEKDAVAHQCRQEARGVRQTG